MTGGQVTSYRMQEILRGIYEETIDKYDVYVKDSQNNLYVTEDELAKL